MSTPIYGLALPSEECGIAHEHSMLANAQGFADSAWDDEDYEGQDVVTQMWGATNEAGSYEVEEDAWFSEKSFDEIMDKLWVYENSTALAYAGLMTVNQNGEMVPTQEETADSFWGVAFVDEAGCYAFGPAYAAVNAAFTGPCPLIDTMFARLRATRKMTQWRRAAAMIHLLILGPDFDQAIRFENMINHLAKFNQSPFSFDEEMHRLASDFDTYAESSRILNGLTFERAEDTQAWFMSTLTHYKYSDVRESILTKAFQPRFVAVFDRQINGRD